MLAKMGYKPNMMDPSNVSSEEDCEDENSSLSEEKYNYNLGRDALTFLLYLK